MEKPIAGEVVVIPFPYSDLTQAKRRPALVLVSLKGDDVILCQITSRAKRDGYSLSLVPDDFYRGALKQDSYVRPNRLFTVHKSVILYSVGFIKPGKLSEVLEATAALFKAQATCKSQQPVEGEP